MGCNKMSKSIKGITLIALIITIIILLILAGVVISFTIGNQGVVEKSQQAVNKYDKEEALEQIRLKVAEAQMEYYLNAKNEERFQAIANYLSEDEQIEYVKLGRPTASINVTGYGSIIVKLKAYIYEFEVTDKLEVKIAEDMEKLIRTMILNNDSLIGKISRVNETGYNQIQINGNINGETKTENYNLHTIVYDGDLVLDGTTNVDIDGITLNNGEYLIGDSSQDVGTSTSYARNTVVLKVNGNLTINPNVKLKACYSATGYGGPKGMIIYCAGTVENNGEISMTARGAYAEGDNVFLWKNANGTFEFIPEEGGLGGDSVESSNSALTGNNGENGKDRKTGGGGSGRLWTSSNRYGKSGAGAKGTSYSGGSGGRRC